MSESRSKDNKMFFSSLSKIMTPSGKIKAFESEDAYSFNEIIDINNGKDSSNVKDVKDVKDGKNVKDSTSRALKKNYKLQNYEDKLYDTFLTIQKNVKLEKNIEVKKKYYNEVIEMQKKVSNRLKKQYTSRAANLLKNIDSWLMSNENLSETKDKDSEEYIGAFGDDNILNKEVRKNYKLFVCECNKRFTTIKNEFNQVDKTNRQNYVDEVLLIKEELNKLPLQFKNEGKGVLLEAIDQWLKNKKLERSKSLNTKNIRRERKLDENKNYSSNFEIFNYEFEKLKKEYENLKEDDEKIECIINISKIGKKVDLIKHEGKKQNEDEKQKEDLLNEIKKWLNDNAKMILNITFDKFENSKKEDEKIECIVNISKIEKKVNLIDKDLSDKIKNWLNDKKKLMSAIMSERKYRWGKGKMFDDSHISDLDSYYVPTTESPESNFIRYSIGPGRGLKSELENLSSNLKKYKEDFRTKLEKLKKDQNEKLMNAVDKQKSKLEGITKNLKENIKKLEEFKEREICKSKDEDEDDSNNSDSKRKPNKQIKRRKSESDDDFGYDDESKRKRKRKKSESDDDSD